ncbi:MAG TPA: DnaA/Hda family protein [Nitrospirota bacterium]|nr:DnaA/Hda family protein [Nitrospirota bacterium]
MFNPNFVFDSFVSTMGNKFARAACMTFARSFNPPYNPLLLYGPTSVGKTHLLHAIGNQFRNLRPFDKVIIVTAEVMMNELLGAISNIQIELFRIKYTSMDLLLVDDIHTLVGRKCTQEELFNIFQTLVAKGGRLAMTSSKSLSDVLILSDEMKSRMKHSLIIRVKPPSRNEVELILSSRFAASVPMVSKNIIKMAASIGSDIRRAEGMIKQMVFVDNLAGFMKSK